MGKLSGKTVLAIASLVLMWGLSWSIYKMSLAYTPPILFAGMRSLIGGLLLALFILPKWKKINWRENWLRYCISAFLNTLCFYGIQTVGLVYLPGGLFSVLVYFQPILIGLFAWLWLGESMTVLKIIGLVMGFLGILAVSADGLTGQVSIVGVILGLLTALTWALGVIYVKKVSAKVDSLWMVAMQCMIGGAALTLLGTGVESWSDIVWNVPYLIGLSYGATFGVPIAIAIYFGLVNAGEASKVAAFTFLVPLIAVVTGTIFMDEPVTYSLIAGLVLIVCSIYLVNYQKKIQKPVIANTLNR
ncbi:MULTISPECIES: DMT family transporter [Brevibacillus]|uniref:DMT family transporter n=1 Tax=Brevibacillus TaxID=55080 RepID=UPI000D0F1C44|nr:MULTISPECIES: DMT family transporter [Brevibacillus]PSJ67416.1 EamA family transporter [Brevibacillus brevis]RED28395.1 threonine/homoserine efflux transporter RhtA [Brevibacillus brevis]TQK74333.1 threonine/homoserine efflux transporter RhtA [Brevibacillus sp. AG162]VEF91090.1 Probable amino-acid metabolite efflux pump [Brevibacillus brevis]GEC90651.1 putative transporter YvbV [Brevibacillus brevis]